MEAAFTCDGYSEYSVLGNGDGYSQGVDIVGALSSALNRHSWRVMCLIYRISSEYRVGCFKQDARTKDD